MKTITDEEYERLTQAESNWAQFVKDRVLGKLVGGRIQFTVSKDGSDVHIVTALALAGTVYQLGQIGVSMKGSNASPQSFYVDIHRLDLYR